MLSSEAHSLIRPKLFLNTLFIFFIAVCLLCLLPETWATFSSHQTWLEKTIHVLPCWLAFAAITLFFRHLMNLEIKSYEKKRSLQLKNN